MSVQPLFTPVRMGDLDLPNRIVMAPLTRMRAGSIDHVPTALQAEYYAQRASAGLIVAEATAISPDGFGYADTPGLWSAEQVRGWRRVTDAVHAAGALSARLARNRATAERVRHTPEPPARRPPQIVPDSAAGTGSSQMSRALIERHYPSFVRVTAASAHDQNWHQGAFLVVRRSWSFSARCRHSARGGAHHDRALLGDKSRGMPHCDEPEDRRQSVMLSGARDSAQPMLNSPKSIDAHRRPHVHLP
jgi:NADH:flavin oxidoreductase / NADH oxidase family